MTSIEQKLQAALGELTFQNILKIQQLEEMAARIAELEKPAAPKAASD